MITIKRIKSTEIEYYSFVEKLYTSSFPKEERRSLELQREYTDHNPIFFNNIILSDQTPIGFISYWEFDTFYYIEHFAVAPNHRNGGYGQKVLEYLHVKLNRPVVLEVEKPTDEFSTRRIQFYKRLGYTLWQNEYLQPPYNEGDGYLPMHLMIFGRLDSEKDFVPVKERLYKEVYKADVVK